jgi:DNA polymerase-1
MAGEKVHIIDGSAQVHRAFFAIRGLSTSKGMPTGAIYGFTTMMRKLVEDEKPRWLGISFDVPGRNFRHEIYTDYKKNRPKMDDELAVQIPYVKRVCEALGVPIIEVPGYEADDVLATLALQAVEKGLRVVLVSGDKDLLQLVSSEVSVLNPGREGSGATLFDAKKVEEKMGVPPERVVDLLALMGDAVDNVPGVRGIGEKGARDLIREYGSLEGVLDNAQKVKRATYRDGLTHYREDALLSKRLVALRTDVPVTLDLEQLRFGEPRRSDAYSLFRELEFVALAREYAPEAAPLKSLFRRIEGSEDLGQLLQRSREKRRIALSLVSRPPLPLDGLALSVAPGESVFVPLGTSTPKEEIVLVGSLLEDESVSKLGPDLKSATVALDRSGLPPRGLAFDATIVSYILNPGRRGYSLEELAYEFLGERIPPVGLSVPGEELEALARHQGREAELLLRLYDPVMARLEEEGLREIFETMELPLVSVLARMEEAGVYVDAQRLAAMSRDMEAELTELTREIHRLAGGEFNINSPIQLREVLFDRLGLKAGKKTAKTRASSTAEDVLEELAASHELPRKILEYRGVQKLKSTYVDALPPLIRKETGRIHATFHQTVAATGRISSSDPNLQNIPIRTPEGRRIREAFRAEEGRLLLSADYSQIELRILAHLSKDETLIETFRRGEDIHDRTSREVFGPFSPLPPEEQRRRSKMINYALLYGKTAFSLAKDIGISRKEADEFIKGYFARYPRVRAFIDETLDRARKTGVVRTLLGRLRRLPDLNARNPPVRFEAERQAVNTPVQGSAADLIKKAMIDLDREIARRSLRSRLILQIHDELLLEVPENEASEAKELVKGVMENALALDVPLVVDARTGASWADVH